MRCSTAASTRIAPTYRKLGDLTHRQREARSSGALCRRRRSATIKGRIDDDSRRASGRASITRAGRAGSKPGSAARSMSRPSSFSARTMSPAERSGGMATVSIEQVLLWNPDVIITIDRDFAASVRNDPAWAPVKAVQARPRASVAQAAVRLGRFSAVGEPADRAVVARQDPLSRAVSQKTCAR